MVRRFVAALPLVLAAGLGCGGRSSLYEAEGLSGTSSVGGAGQGGSGTGGTNGTGGAVSVGGGGGHPVGLCGDGALDRGEDCDLGPQNLDTPALRVTQGAFSADVMPLDRVGDAKLFYSYQNGGSHTLLEAVGESRLFLYRDTSTGLLSLFANHGIDQIASGQDQPKGRVEMSFEGLPEATFVAVADDDPQELSKDSTTTATGNWHFIHNTDGGVLSGLPFPGVWSVTVRPSFLLGITSFVWIDAEEMRTELSLEEPVTITSFGARSSCRTDCTLPFCGDGIVDGGEVCDDGNTQGGDGCAADCNSLD